MKRAGRLCCLLAALCLAGAAVAPRDLALQRGLAALSEGEYAEAASFLAPDAGAADTRAVAWQAAAHLRDGEPAAAAAVYAAAGDTVAAEAVRAVFLRTPAPDRFHHTLLRVIDGAVEGRGAFVSPTGIALLPSGDLLVAALGSGAVEQFAADGTWRRTLYRGAPYGVAVAPDGSIWVSDFRAHCLVHLAADGTELRRCGTRGSAPGELLGPEGLAVDGDGAVYVADNGNHRVQKFAADGRFLLLCGRRGDGDGELDGPTGVTLLPGEVQVTDAGNRRLARYDRSGNWLAAYGSDVLGTPRGVAYDDETVFVADRDRGLFAFTPDGELIGRLRDAEGARIGGRAPAAVQVRDGLVAAADYAGAAARLYRFGAPATGRNHAVLTPLPPGTDLLPTVSFRLGAWGAGGVPLTGLTARQVRVTEAGVPMHPVLLSAREELSTRWQVIILGLGSDRLAPENFARGLWRELPAGTRAQVWGRAAAPPAGWAATRTALLEQAQAAAADGPRRPLDELIDDAVRVLQQVSARRALVIASDRWTENAAVQRALQRARLNHVPVRVVAGSGTGVAAPCTALTDYQPHLLVRRLLAASGGEYLLAYDSPGAAAAPRGTWRPVTVRIDAHGVVAEWQGGYLIR